MINFSFQGYDKPIDADAPKVNQLLTEIATDPMGGWFDLPLENRDAELSKIKSAAEKIQNNSEVLVCIGIGGSYLGHRAIIEALKPKSKTKIIYAGNSLSKRSLDQALKAIDGHDFSVNVISKSGTTLEPARAFSAFKAKLIEKYGEAEAKTRIFATTDAEKGTLHDEAVENGYERLIVPDNIGGRYSVFSAVGLLPLAVSGVNIVNLLRGAKNFRDTLHLASKDNENTPDIASNADNPAAKYALFRSSLMKENYDTEVFATFEPQTLYFNEWLKQLFGESEGKEKSGIFPASMVYSTDLHSLGQFMQDGRRNLFETLLNFPTDEDNEKLVKAVETAHLSGGIPVAEIDIPSFDEEGFGELIQFFETTCALSAKFQGKNPFDQPGVEAYKSELKKLLND